MMRRRSSASSTARSVDIRRTARCPPSTAGCDCSPPENRWPCRTAGIRCPYLQKPWLELRTPAKGRSHGRQIPQAPEREYEPRLACANSPCRHNRRICAAGSNSRSEEHTSELQSQSNLVCRLLLEKKKKLSAAPVFTM